MRKGDAPVSERPYFLSFFENRTGKSCWVFRKATVIFARISAKLWMRKETANEKRRENTMKNSNQINVPQAREAMDKFKMQAASDEGVSATS